ncbi:MAG: polymer-forming cytoskeletal protein [Candidatus Latescibacteria bacterium]|nr:polymer-forming cytoskeletal protein [Candidatus Latescibacterota bacterium]
MSAGRESREATVAGHTVIGRGTVVEGVLKMEHSLRIEGLVRGESVAASSLVVSPQGELEAGLIEVDEAVISGRVTGKLRARVRVYVSAGAVFRGSVETPQLVIEEGAVFVQAPLAAKSS